MAYDFVTGQELSFRSDGDSIIQLNHVSFLHCQEAPGYDVESCHGTIDSRYNCKLKQPLDQILTVHNNVSQDSAGSTLTECRSICDEEESCVGCVQNADRAAW